MLNNFSVHHVVSSPLLLITFGLAFPAWIIAFASQIAAEAQFHIGTGVLGMSLPSASFDFVIIVHRRICPGEQRASCQVSVVQHLDTAVSRSSL